MFARNNNTPATPFPLDRIIQEFLIDRQARALSAKTLVWYKQSLGIFRHFLIEQQTTNPRSSPFR